MNHYLPISEAIRQHPGVDLYSLIQQGKIKAAMYTTGDVIVSDEEIQANLPKEERPEYVNHAHLKGVAIGIREAARKYGVSAMTIKHWIDSGYIAQLGSKTVRGGTQILIDEADVAYCNEIRKRNPGQGHWLFNSDGTPRK